MIPLTFTLINQEEISLFALFLSACLKLIKMTHEIALKGEGEKKCCNFELFWKRVKEQLHLNPVWRNIHSAWQGLLMSKHA